MWQVASCPAQQAAAMQMMVVKGKVPLPGRLQTYTGGLPDTRLIQAGSAHALGAHLRPLVPLPDAPGRVEQLAALAWEQEAHTGGMRASMAQPEARLGRWPRRGVGRACSSRGWGAELQLCELKRGMVWL